MFFQYIYVAILHLITLVYFFVLNNVLISCKCRVKIVPYVMTWDGIVTKCHKKYITEIGLQPKTEAYIQALVMRKTLESLSFERRRGLEEELLSEEPEMMSKRLLEDDQRFKVIA
ncbi:hypothetical protein BDAP_001736 [Binucleata daphniae]